MHVGVVGGDDYVKARRDAPDGYFYTEACGLLWLAEARGAQVVDVRSATSTTLRLERLQAGNPSRRAAAAFGAALAATHDAGADAWGSGPDGLDIGYFGPLTDPVAQPYAEWDSWGEFYASARIEPWVELAVERGGLDSVEPFVPLLRRLRAGEFDDDDVPARLHGDLWSGNLLWTAEGVVLIDPSAHGGHRETDLAMLELFGCPYLDDIQDAYEAAHPLREGWGERTDLHQLHAVVAHAALFGGAYGRRALSIAARYAS